MRRMFLRLGTRICGAALALGIVAERGNAASCDTLPDPTGPTRIVTPAEAGSLAAIVSSVAPGTAVLLEDGIYPVAQSLYLRKAGVTLRSRSGNRDAVVLDGAYGSAREIINIMASDVTVAHLTVKRALDHPIHVQSPDGQVNGTRIYDVHVLDAGQQAIKINPGGGGFTDNGLIACSLIELTDAGRTQIRDNCYTGGIDAHQSMGWVIRDNTVAGFWCPSGLAEHGIHLWTGSRDTVVERNRLINNARGIGFGLGLQWNGRSYADAPCAGRTNVGHYGGTIRNNFVFANDAQLFSSGAGVDTGIGLEDSCGVFVGHNTVFTTQPPGSSSVEWRFNRADGRTVPPTVIANNLTSHALRARDGAQADETGNVQGATAGLFVNAAAGDLHLAAAAVAAIDAGAPVGVATDIDGQPRDATPDLGADERSAAPPTDGPGGGDPNPPTDPNPPGEPPPPNPLLMEVVPDSPILTVRTVPARRGRTKDTGTLVLYVGVATQTLPPSTRVRLLAALAGAPPGVKATVKLGRRELRMNQLTSITVKLEGPAVPTPGLLYLGVISTAGGVMRQEILPIQLVR